MCKGPGIRHSWFKKCHLKIYSLCKLPRDQRSFWDIHKGTGTVYHNASRTGPLPSLVHGILNMVIEKSLDLGQTPWLCSCIILVCVGSGTLRLLAPLEEKGSVFVAVWPKPPVHIKLYNWHSIWGAVMRVQRCQTSRAGVLRHQGMKETPGEFVKMRSPWAHPPQTHLGCFAHLGVWHID